MRYVQHVRGKWVVRVTVPEDLRDIMGQRELVDADLPADTRKRERLAHGIINRFLCQIEEARETLRARAGQPAPALSLAAKAHYESMLRADDEKRAALPTVVDLTAEYQRLNRSIEAGEIEIGHGFPAMINSMTEYELMRGARDHYAKNRARRLSVLRDSFRSGETRWIEQSVQQYLSDNKLAVEYGTHQWFELANVLTRAEIEALERTMERDRGAFGGQPIDPFLTMPDPEIGQSAPSSGKASGITLSEALDAFHNERTAGGNTLAMRTMEEHKNAARMFNEFMGSDVGVRSITKKNVIDYKGALLSTPNRYTMRFPGLTLPQAIKANAKLSKPFSTLAPQTINMKWLSHLSTILQWASNNGHIDSNPAQGIRVDTGSKVHKAASYEPFSNDELQIIFGTPMFKDPSEYGLMQWALLVMLYTGVRNSSEMAQMTLANIYKEQGIPVFFLETASKNQRSKRLVPIHADLVKLGFLDYVAAQRYKGETHLFPGWAKRTDKVNDWFNVTYLPSLGLKNKQKVFYSFRHTLSSNLIRLGVPRETSKMISGHVPQEIHSVYVHESPVSLMYRELSKLQFDLPITGLRKSLDSSSLCEQP